MKIHASLPERGEEFDADSTFREVLVEVPSAAGRSPQSRWAETVSNLLTAATCGRTAVLVEMLRIEVDECGVESLRQHMTEHDRKWLVDILNTDCKGQNKK